MLKDRLKFLVKDTAMYGIANGVSRFMVFLTIPIIARHIDLGEFGVWNMLTILGSFVSAVLIFGMDSAVMRYYYDQDSRKHHRNVFSHGFYIQLILILFFFCISFFLPSFFLKSIGVSNSYTDSLLIVFLWVPANVFTQYFQNWFKWTFQRFRFLTIAIGMAGINVVLLCLYVQLQSLSLNSILFIQAISAWTFTILGLWWCRKLFVLRMHKRLAANFISYGFPMMLIMVIGILSPAIDRLFLTHLVTEDRLGIYSFIQKVSVIIMVVVTAFQTAFGPFSYSIWKKSDAPTTFSKFQTYYLMTAGMIALGTCCFSRPLILLLGTPEYLGSEKYLPFLVLGGLIYGLYSFAAIGIFYSKRMSLNLLALSIGLGTVVMMNLWLSPAYKEYGVAIGFLSGNFVMVLIAYHFSKNYFKIRFAYSKDFAILSTLFVLSVVSTVPFTEDLFTDALLKALTLLSSYILFCLLLLTKGEKEYVFRFVKGIPSIKIK